MKKELTFTGKMVFRVDSDGGRMTIRFTSCLKEDLVERMLRITVLDNRISSIYFSSNKYGTSLWIKGRGITESHRWENEEDLQDISYLLPLSN